MDFCEIEATDQQIKNAVEKSTSQRAKEAEKRYLDSQQEKQGITELNLHNRASQKNETTHLKEIEQETALITRRCGYLMKQLGYIDHDNFDPPPSYLPNSKLLSFYKELNVPDSFWERQEDGLENTRIASILHCFTNQEYSGLWSPNSWQENIYEFLVAFERTQKNKLISQTPTMFRKIYLIVVPWFIGYKNTRRFRRWLSFMLCCLKKRS